MAALITAAEEAVATGAADHHLTMVSGLEPIILQREYRLMEDPVLAVGETFRGTLLEPQIVFAVQSSKLPF